MSFHSNLSGLDIHTLVAFTYANAAARTGALGLVIGDIGKVARQADDGSFWILVSASPVTWFGFGGDASALATATRALLIAQAGTNAANSADSWARDAFSIAVAGTDAANIAFVLAGEAFTLATAFGTTVANAAFDIATQAFNIAVSGTNAANAAAMTAGMALNLAWTGTTAANEADSWARDAFSIAVNGTNAANHVNTIAIQALDTSWVGTNAANQAYTLAGEAYTLAQAGTNAVISGAFLPLAGGVMSGTMTVPNVQVGVGTVSYFTNSGGTIAYDFTGAAYQQTTVNGALHVSASNPSPGREIAILLIADGSARVLTYDTNFAFYAATPPASITNKNILLALTSLTSSLSGVIGASSTAQ
jgi:hypothetical protein